MEKVLAVPADKITALVPAGFVKTDEQKMLSFIAREGKFYDRTPELENDLSLKQIIPYILVSHAEKFLIYQRAPKGGDSRLHKKYSLAFGGHVNPADAAAGLNPVIGCRSRELNEEVGLPVSPSFTFLGTLNIAIAPIDRVHLGFIYLATLPSPEFSSTNPDEITTPHWETPAQIAEKFENLESWSQAVFSSLFPALVPIGHSATSVA